MMKVKLKEKNVWIHWQDQCDLCKEFEFQYPNKHMCNKEAVKELNLKLGLIEANTKDVYGTIEFRCDYFCIDEEKYKKSKYSILDVAKKEEGNDKQDNN